MYVIYIYICYIYICYIYVIYIQIIQHFNQPPEHVDSRASPAQKSLRQGFEEGRREVQRILQFCFGGTGGTGSVAVPVSYLPFQPLGDLKKDAIAIGCDDWIILIYIRYF